MKFLPYFMLLLSACMSALASVLIKIAGQPAPALPWPGLAARPALLFACAVGIYGVGFVFYALALKKLELSVAYPVMVAATILLIYAYGLYAGEAINVQSVVGAVLMILSVFLIYSR